MNKKLRRFIIAGAAISAVGAGLYGASKFFIRHEQLPLVDFARKDFTGKDRSVPVDVYVRRDKEMRATLGTIDPLPVVIISHGNTLKSYQYSFAANYFAAEGYLVLSIQHDLPTDPPLANEKGKVYWGRLPSYERGSANIDFVVDAFKKQEPIADYDHLTLLGHSQGGDITVFYASTHPDTVTRVITFDNLRMPLEFVRAKLLSIRGNNEGFFKPDPGVVPCATDCEKGNVTVFESKAHHTNLDDNGPDEVKGRLIDSISKFLSNKKSPPKRPNDPVMGNDYHPLPSVPY